MKEARVTMWPFLISWTVFCMLLWGLSVITFKGMYDHFIQEHTIETPVMEFERQEDPTEREAKQYFTLNGVRDVYIQLPVQASRLYTHQPVDNLED